MRYCGIIIVIVIIVLIIISILVYCSWYINVCGYYKCSFRGIKNLLCLDRNYLTIPKIKSRRKVVISLTTTPFRIDKLHGTLASLLTQTYRVDEIYINIPYISLKGEKYEIPKFLTQLKNIKINRIEKDYGPASKLLPSLIKEDKETIIIVVDDDIIYGPKMVETYISIFYRMDEKYAFTIFGWRITKQLKLTGGLTNVIKYIKFKEVDILAGYSSFLVTREMFPSNIFNYDVAPKECIWVDDIWISGWLAFNNIKIYSLGFCYNNISICDFNNYNVLNALSSTANSTSNNADITIKWFHDNYKIWDK